MGQSRNENILENMLGASNPLGEPQSREEALLMQLLEKGGTSSHNYSTEEQIVGTWIDGTPIYEKTIYNAGGVTGNFNFQHGISDLKNIISYKGVVSDSAYSQYGDIWAIPRIASDGNPIGIDKVSSTTIYVTNPSAFGTRLYDWYITIQYTKITDVAGN